MPKDPGKGKPLPEPAEEATPPAVTPEPVDEPEPDFDGYFPPSEDGRKDGSRAWSPTPIPIGPSWREDGVFVRRTETIIENSRTAIRTFQISQLASQLQNGTAARAPSALLICLHGYLQTSAWACANVCEPWAVELGYLSVCPQGYAVGGGANNLGWGWNSNDGKKIKKSPTPPPLIRNERPPCL